MLLRSGALISSDAVKTGFHELADSFQAAKDTLTPVWERAAKEASAELRDFEALEALVWPLMRGDTKKDGAQSNQEGEKEPPKAQRRGL